MILFIDACAREASRTRELAQALLNKLGSNYESLNLYDAGICSLDEEMLNKRTKLCDENRYDDSFFNLAKQFASADIIVIAAPFWDLSFPSILKCYIENISVTGITFKYSESGIPIGLCKAKELYYVTTAGGTIFDSSFGYGYIEALSKQMFGIKKCALIKAENLDIIGNNPDEIIDRVKKDIIKLY